MADEPLCFYCNEPRVALGCWSEDHTGIGLCGGHAKELGATFHHMEPTPESLEEIPEVDFTHRRLFRKLAEGWRIAHDDLGLGDLPEGYVLPMGLLAAANPYWQESVQQWKKLHAHTSRDTLFRRALYGGRKGRRALVRLGDSYEADRVRELHGIRPMRRRGERRRRVRCELEQLRARLMERDRVRGGDGSNCKQENRWTPTRTLPNK